MHKKVITMNVIVVADGHYYRDKDGIVYAQTTYDYAFYRRYLSVFDKVYAIVRIEEVNEAPKGLKQSSGENVEFLALPSYTGPWQYARVYFRLRKILNEYCKLGECGIFRVPSATSNITCKIFSKTKKPYAIEVVTDPWINFSPKIFKSILGPIIRLDWTLFVRKQCKIANGVSYVTEKYLQSKYPCKAMTKTSKGDNNYFTSSYSSVELPDENFAKPRIFEGGEVCKIVHTANTFTDYGKGHITLMKALKIVKDRGYKIEACFIGDGPKKKEFIEFANCIGIGDIVTFAGRLPSVAEVKNALSQNDIFVFPTFAEGLPRGLLEAMSEGLPCLSSPTCGIPEVLDNEYLYEFDDYEGFANGIINFIENPDEMTKQSKRNIEVARKYATSLLTGKRNEFYQSLKELTYSKENN